MLQLKINSQEEKILKLREAHFEQVQNFVKSIDREKYNYYGILYGEVGASVACVKCGKMKYNFEDFVEFGPNVVQNRYLCTEHASEYKTLLVEAERTHDKVSEKELLDLISYFDQRCLQMHKGELNTQIPWVFVG